MNVRTLEEIRNLNKRKNSLLNNVVTTTDFKSEIDKEVYEGFVKPISRRVFTRQCLIEK